MEVPEQPRKKTPIAGKWQIFGQEWSANNKGPGDLARALDDYGEPDRDRTCDPLIKSQLLYRLSYRPTMRG